MSGEVVRLEDRCTVEVYTLAKFRRPANPRRCSSRGYYHVWRWRGGPAPPAGTRCQCGLLADPRPQPE